MATTPQPTITVANTFTDWFTAQKEKSSHFIISVIGPHGGEGMKEIYTRKQLDITNVGYTLWTVNITTRKFQTDDKVNLDFNWGATADEAKQLCLAAKAKGEEVYILFVCTDGKGNEGVPTKEAFKASHFWTDSIDSKTALPELLSPLTGKMTDGTGAYKFDQMTIFDTLTPIDLSKFGMWRSGDAGYHSIKTTLGVGNVCAKYLPVDAKKIGKEMTKSIRSVQGVARLCEPFTVNIFSEQKEAERAAAKSKKKGGKRKDENMDAEEDGSGTAVDKGKPKGGAAKPKKAKK